MDFAEVFSTSLYEPHFAQPQYTRSSGGDQPPITLIFIVIAAVGAMTAAVVMLVNGLQTPRPGHLPPQTGKRFLAP